MHEPPLDLSRVAWSEQKEAVRVFYQEMWDHADMARPSSRSTGA